MKNPDENERVSLYYGDCCSLLDDFEDNSIDIVISDIPYGINYDGWDVFHQNTNSGFLKTHKSMDNTTFKTRGKPINGWSEEDKLQSLKYQEWCEIWCNKVYRITKEGSPILLFSSRRNLHRVGVALENSGFLIRDILIWEKDKCNAKAQRISNVLMKRGIVDSQFDNYRIGNLAPFYEPIIWAMKPYKKTLTDCVIEHKVGGFVGENNKVPSNIIKCACNKKNIYHPAEKPLSLMNYIINMFTISPNTIILDMFMGSGTTGLAAVECNRKFIGIEYNHEIFEIAQQRIREKLINENDCK